MSLRTRLGEVDSRRATLAVLRSSLSQSCVTTTSAKLSMTSSRLLPLTRPCDQARIVSFNPTFWTSFAFNALNSSRM